MSQGVPKQTLNKSNYNNNNFAEEYDNNILKDLENDSTVIKKPEPHFQQKKEIAYIQPFKIAQPKTLADKQQEIIQSPSKQQEQDNKQQDQQHQQMQNSIKTPLQQLKLKNTELKNNFINKYIKDPQTQNYKLGIVKKKYPDNSLYFGNVDSENVNNGKGIFLISNGDIYFGDFKKAKYDGEGVYIHSNCERYEGDFKQGKKQGKGTYFYETGDTYYGKWENNRRSEDGVGYYEEAKEEESRNQNKQKETKNNFKAQQQQNLPSDQYNGGYVNNKREGKGQLIYPDGSVYKGDFKNDLPNGQGTFEGSNGDTFDGIVADGKKVKGILREKKSGNIYEGSFKNEKFQGQGSMSYADGQEYQGNWEQGKKSGEGKLQSQGFTYQGQFKDDLVDGEGYCQYNNGDEYHGKWAKGSKTFGKQIYAEDNITYEGEWRNGQRHGKGIMVWKNSNNDPTDSYDGEWSQDRKHGKGTYRSYDKATGKYISEIIEFNNDQIISRKDC